jgi:hypothetical protein
MPTPFMHLKVAQDLLRDSQVPPPLRDLLNAHRGAFLLGSIAADARISSGIKRDHTHFYRYDEELQDHPWRTMLECYPSLWNPPDLAQRVFVAAYVAHLAMDELWMIDMLRPQFWSADWGTRESRFFTLHILLSAVDARDYDLIEDWQAQTLLAAQPCDWLPFISDTDLHGWRDFIGTQLIEGSETLDVLSARVKSSPEDFRAVLESRERMQADLWAQVPQATLAQVEAAMYVFAREQMLVYLAEQ